MILATTHTSHFEFTALAETEAEAIDALLLGWARHVEQTGADSELMAQIIAEGDVNFTPIAPGVVLRDGSQI